MAFVDIKCLESLLIEGEEIIATEGIGSKLASAANRIFGMLKNMINFVIRAISNVINKLKSKKPVSAKSNVNNSDNKSESNKLNSEEFKPASKTPPSDEESKAWADAIKKKYDQSKTSKSTNKVLPDAKFTADTNAMVDIISPLVQRIFNCWQALYINESPKELCESNIEKIGEYRTKASNMVSDYSDKYKSRVTIYITSKNKDSLLKELESCLNALSGYKTKIDNFSDSFSNKLADFEQGTLQVLVSSINETQQIANIVCSILAKAETVEDRNDE